MRGKTLGLGLALTLVCSACALAPAREGAAEGEARVWFLSAQNNGRGSALVSEDRTLPQDGGRVEGLLSLLLEGPESMELRSPFPRGTEVRSWRVEDGLAVLDLSEAYGGLSGVGLTLADGCIVETLCQLPEVERVYLTVEGRPRPFRDQVFSAGDFLLDNGSQEERQRTVRLWFLQGEGMAAEERTLALRMGDQVEIAAVQALLKGPESGELEAVCPPGTTLLSLTWEGSRYTVDLSGSWLEGEEDPRRVLAVAETLMELDPEGAVVFLVEGQTLESFGGIDLRRPLGADLGA